MKNDPPVSAAYTDRPSLKQRLLMHEDLNFLLTNRVPRIALTRLVGWFSQLQSPLLARLSIAVWRWFTPLDLSEAEHTRFGSLHACFTRRLKPGARPFDTREPVLCSPSDGIVGDHGRIEGTRVWQAKGFPYTLDDLLGSEELAERYANGCYVTLRLTSAMYHRFHAPADLTVDRVTYISGDTWNVNPVALKRVERLFCKNERAVIETRLGPGGAPMALVPVAAILVASIRLHFINVLLHLRYRGPNVIPCQVSVQRGDELGWFEHGSTIIMLVPAGFDLATGLGTGQTVRAGQALWQTRSV
ncbi:archaetidylserine decarboxylase [Hydrogenophaga sp.]|uniref:archaetidylserine decarboxylase n=1 Tax=Hydrogenophaga sp. TaxID=1904254 RepID=UPI0026283920|nr:archaetidylserine decarboxylase [Hydrogenophaga sp.]MDM7948627.1 archaetidylserine decarboxylase [Hydrogenophaga sp.]